MKRNVAEIRLGIFADSNLEAGVATVRAKGVAEMGRVGVESRPTDQARNSTQAPRRRNQGSIAARNSDSNGGIETERRAHKLRGSTHGSLNDFLQGEIILFDQ